MTNQEKKEFLQQYKLAEIEEQRLEHEIERWRERAGKTTQRYSLANVSGSDKRGDDVLVMLGDKARELTEQMEKLIKLREKIEKAINSVDEFNLRELLRLRYIDGLRWEEVAVRMHYSWRQVIRLHGIALDHVMECHIDPV